jgi:signal recognition particle subunit SEC65
MAGEVVDGSGRRRRGRQYKNTRIVDDPSNHQIIDVGHHIVLSKKTQLITL